MTATLPAAGDKYDQRNEAETRNLVVRAFAQFFRRGSDVEVGAGRVILKSPDGTRWALTVADDGTVGADGL